MIRNRVSRWIIVSALMLCTGIGLTGCGGGSGASSGEIAQAEKHGRELRAEKEKERKLERAIQKLKEERREEKKRKREKERERKSRPSQPSHESTPAPAPEPSTPSGTDCGEGVVAGPETSCGFAINTRNEYEYYVGSGPGTVEAFSEANETWYSMTCTAAPHECSGAISATVYFP